MKRLNLSLLALLAAAFAGCGDDASSNADPVDAGCVPTAESCDGLDNNCNGQVDENLSQACQGSGIQACENGAWGACQLPPAEVCNGQDDDGDGASDEDLERNCNTPCGTGTERCSGGAWVGCDAPQPGTESCNGEDDDCDGQVDEDLTRTCESDCGQGEETCSLGAWVGCDAREPVAETCNNEDDDCDGQVDEDVSRDCGDPACGPGAETCQAGLWLGCTGRQPAAQEDCATAGVTGNGIDDDCNGQIDDHANCAGGCEPASQRLCSVDRGVCQRGEQVCDNARAWGPCELNGSAVIEPGQQEETCDGLDNDCDGAVDESFAGDGEACGVTQGLCIAGTRRCVDGAEICQDEVAAVDELCDALDNDCDGETDEGLSPDNFETNENCVQAENLGSVTENGDPRRVTATLYPSGDVDTFAIKIQEETDFCVPFVDPDLSYDVAVVVSNLPADVDYELCLMAGDDNQDIQAFCSGEMLLEETCTDVRTAQGTLVLGYTSEAVCGLTDDTTAVITVRAKTAQDFSCQPYTIQVISATTPE